MASNLVDILKAVREQAAKLHTRNLDPDFYAMRSAYDLFGYFPRHQKSAALLSTGLTHESEAVRMQAAMAIGRAKYASLAADLRKMMTEDAEYAAYGAAWGLARDQ